MKSLFIVLIFHVFLEAVSYETFYRTLGDGHKDSVVDINGTLNLYVCKKKPDDYCKIFISAYSSNNSFIAYTAVHIDSSNEQILKEAVKGDVMSYSCIYKKSIFTFKECHKTPTAELNSANISEQK